MKIIILFFVLIFCVYSCGFKGYTQNFETTITVVDSNDKPIKGQIVKFYKESYSQYVGTRDSPQEVKTTDDNGIAVFSYGLEIWDSGTDFATFISEDDNKWKLLSFPNHSVSGKKKKKQTFKIVKDSLTTVRVKLAKTTSTLNSLQLFSGSYSNASEVNYSDTYARNSDENITHIQWSKKNVGIFDSLFTFKVVSSAKCFFSASVWKDSITPSGGIISTSDNHHHIDLIKGQKRDMIFELTVR